MDYDKKRAFLNVAEELSRVSRCVLDKNAAVVVKDGVLIGTGINGTLPGMVNCDEYFADDDLTANHDAFSMKYESEAEMNAILLCSKHGISCNQASIYTLKMPRAHIVKYLAISGIREIYYRIPLNEHQSVIETARICEMMGIKIARVL